MHGTEEKLVKVLVVKSEKWTENLVDLDIDVKSNCT